MTQENINKILELYKLGVPKTKIAATIGCSTPTVLKYIREANTTQTDSMIGQTFGYLTVLKRADKRADLKSRCIRYTCQCNCGNIIEVNGNSLRTGHTQSCGCLRKENVSYNDLTGQRFGKLTVISLVDSTKDRRKLWKCKCDCGNICEIDSHSLLSGHVQSCGCLHSYKEIEIQQLLTLLNVNFKKEYTFSDLRGKRNPLRFDFAILDSNDTVLCLIEYQGQQHYNVNNNWNTEQLKESDKKKKEYCQLNNIPLYELNINDNLEERIKEIIKVYGY